MKLLIFCLVLLIPFVAGQFGVKNDDLQEASIGVDGTIDTKTESIITVRNSPLDNHIIRNVMKKRGLCSRKLKLFCWSLVKAKASVESSSVKLVMTKL